MIICVHLSPQLGCDGQLETLQQPLFLLRRHGSHSETLSKFIMGHFQSVVTEVCRANRTENRPVDCQCRQFSSIKCPSNGQLANTKFSAAIEEVSSPIWCKALVTERKGLGCVDHIPVLLLQSLSLTLSVSWAKNSMISSSCCSTIVSHWRKKVRTTVPSCASHRKSSRIYPSSDSLFIVLIVL